ncbi:MAG TPA: 16S rRNA (guanine(966)-N(2))-methyltransferase RsmD, partial [Armatimonadetes bacterium]|nr:16S rRNA (guanine(966)-N(2))-methyltransferase RsmD [Armatimonadota bacterium]
MRILGGQAKGQRLKTGAGRQVRPTAAAVRKVLFDILGPHLEGTRFLDLFAGYGSVGLEALSRGAAQAVFVERNRQCCRVLAENLHALGWQERGEVLCAEVHRALETLAHRGEQFEVIFADPPYGVTAASECLAWLGVHPS